MRERSGIGKSRLTVLLLADGLASAAGGALAQESGVIDMPPGYCIVTPNPLGISHFAPVELG